MDQYDHMKTVRAITGLCWRKICPTGISAARSRRFYAEELTEDKKSVYATTYEVLVGVAKLIAPIAPFIADEIYTESDRRGYRSRCRSSRRLMMLTWIDKGVEERMDLVRALVGLGRGTREKERIKGTSAACRRCWLTASTKALIGDLVPLIKEELNVKDVVFREQTWTHYMNYSSKAELQGGRPVLGRSIKAFGAALAAGRSGRTVAASVEADGKTRSEISDGEIHGDHQRTW